MENRLLAESWLKIWLNTDWGSSLDLIFPYADIRGGAGSADDWHEDWDEGIRA